MNSSSGVSPFSFLFFSFVSFDDHIVLNNLFEPSFEQKIYLDSISVVIDLLEIVAFSG